MELMHSDSAYMVVLITFYHEGDLSIQGKILQNSVNTVPKLNFLSITSIFRCEIENGREHLTAYIVGVHIW
ncbi:hypothetical protein P8452_03247 [Trifolium repens]|nr:hypothetical protein P8452_03247 [Trifolium repens]